MSLLSLPYELLAYVVGHLHLADIRSLAFSCRRLEFLLYEANMTKLVLESKAPYSPEACEARESAEEGKAGDAAKDGQGEESHATALRRLIQRRDAIASVSPYLVATVAFAEEWLFENGVLCYTRGLQMRILDLHRAAHDEIVVNVRDLVSQKIQDSRVRHKYKLTLLHYSHRFVSCSYTLRRDDCSDGSQHWLLVFNPVDGEIAIARQLGSVSKLFVRNNAKFLYYGTASEPTCDGSGRWVINGFDLVTHKLLGQPLEIPTPIGTDIGSTICFDIFDDYMYCLSNQRSLHVEDLDFLSYYTCFRIPLARDGFDVEEPAEALWRRDRTDGPLDDRWTFLRMFKDETTGQLMAVEARKEWLSGRISARRAYYTTAIKFDDSVDREKRPLGYTDRQICAAKRERTGPAKPQTRDPHLVHLGDDSATVSLTLSKCPLRAYYPACQTFIDLIDDSSSFDPAHQQLRIRGGTRRPRAPAELAPRTMETPPPPASASAAAAQEEGLDNHNTFLQQVEDLYRTEADLFWPPKQDPAVNDPALAGLYATLNPPGYFGNPQGTWDDRSLVYATGGGAGGAVGGLRALVFVSWDPNIRLKDARPYPGGATSGLEIARHRPPNASRYFGENLAPKTPLDGKDKLERPVSWRTLEPARYRKISRGYHFTP
ncbi:hypothetical protein C8A05DRAFT_15017 [Staphylotrichum tortipilum]|uniref:F-box domain-containing protein n=1 Tax=Staphylotrichum tortipilum TaxID=2831512 RepID=A0AAN6MMJ1_9PEZI|nr:hypothetical protein C8A05DRAFT_15017 [Staphylotrichum longicolle]